jgi:hypothetical protein
MDSGIKNIIPLVISFWYGFRGISIKYSKACLFVGKYGCALVNSRASDEE